MARTKNPEAPAEEDAQTLQTKVTTEVAASFRILAMVNRRNPTDYLRDLVNAALEANPVEISVGGKPFDPSSNGA
jgi:hypothetical protein